MAKYKLTQKAIDAKRGVWDKQSRTYFHAGMKKKVLEVKKPGPAIKNGVNEGLLELASEKSE